MNNDFNNAIGPIIGIFLVALIVVPLLLTISAIVTEDKCRPYQEQISQRDTQIAGLNKQINATNLQLQRCKTDYQSLIESNITKKDFEEIKGYFNITQIKIDSLNSRFNAVSNNYYNIQNIIIRQYNISRAFNVVFGLELLSFVLLKNELVMFALKFIRKRLKKQELQSESKEQKVK